MPQKSNDDYKEKYHYVCSGTIEPMDIKDLSFCRTPASWDTSKAHNDIKFGKEVKTIMVVDRSLYSLMCRYFSFCFNVISNA